MFDMFLIDFEEKMSAVRTTDFLPLHHRTFSEMIKNRKMTKNKTEQTIAITVESMISPFFSSPPTSSGG
jgi:hypothetical protein